jgi:hypothetical protein
MMSKMIEKKTRGVLTARAQKFRQAMYDAMGEKGDEIMRPEVQELDQVGGRPVAPTLCYADSSRPTPTTPHRLGFARHPSVFTTAALWLRS